MKESPRCKPVPDVCPPQKNARTDVPFLVERFPYQWACDIQVRKSLTPAMNFYEEVLYLVSDELQVPVFKTVDMIKRGLSSDNPHVVRLACNALINLTLKDGDILLSLTVVKTLNAGLLYLKSYAMLDMFNQYVLRCTHTSSVARKMLFRLRNEVARESAGIPLHLPRE